MVERDYVFALSRFGMPFEVFLELSPKEFFSALYEKEKHEADMVLAQIKSICNVIRLQTFHLVNVQLPKGKQVRDVKQLMKFEWDKARPAQTVEEMKGIMKAIAQSFKGKGKTDGTRKRRNR